MVATAATAHQWQPALFMLGFGFSFLLHAPLLVVATVLFVLMAVSLGVASLNSGPDSDAFDNFFLWNAFAVVFGSVVGGFLPVVICAPPFITLDSFVHSPKRRFWPIAVVGLGLLGVVLLWGLLASIRWLWLVPVALATATIAVSFALLRYDRLWRVTVGQSLAVHGYWLLFQFGIMLTFGLVQELYTSRHGVDASHFMRVLVALVGATSLALLGALNIYLPSGVKIENRHVHTTHGVFLHELAHSEHQNPDGGVEMTELHTDVAAAAANSSDGVYL